MVAAVVPVIAQAFRAAALFAILCAATDRGNVFTTGNDLKTSCEKFEGFCYGYIEGIADAMAGGVMTQVYDYKACVPNEPGISAGQLKDIILRYLTNHPETRDWAGAGLVAHALEETFPCK
jgi:hypothetical protein